jgi:hypothetical protein
MRMKYNANYILCLIMKTKVWMDAIDEYKGSPSDAIGRRLSG